MIFWYCVFHSFIFRNHCILDRFRGDLKPVAGHNAGTLNTLNRLAVYHKTPCIHNFVNKWMWLNYLMPRNAFALCSFDFWVRVMHLSAIKSLRSLLRKLGHTSTHFKFSMHDLLLAIFIFSSCFINFNLLLHLRSFSFQTKQKSRPFYSGLLFFHLMCLTTG